MSQYILNYAAKPAAYKKLNIN